jgi:hypothetical protein
MFIGHHLAEVSEEINLTLNLAADSRFYLSSSSGRPVSSVKGICGPNSFCSVDGANLSCLCRPGVRGSRSNRLILAAS